MHSSVYMCPCAPMWPMVWYIPKISSTLHIFCTHVSVCAHMPSFGKWCTYKLWYWLLIVSPWFLAPQCGQCFDTNLWPLRLVLHFEVMWQYLTMRLMIWYIPITSKTGLPFEVMWLFVNLCPLVSKGLIPPTNSNTCCSFWTHLYVCAHVPHVANG